MCEPELIYERAVYPKRMTVIAFDLPFRNEFPTKLPAALLQNLKSRPNSSLVRDADGLELTQSFVIILDWLVGRFEVQSFHSRRGRESKDPA